MHVDFPMPILKMMKSRKKPFHCKGGCHADREQPGFAKCVDRIDGKG